MAAAIAGGLAVAGLGAAFAAGGRDDVELVAAQAPPSNAPVAPAPAAPRGPAGVDRLPEVAQGQGRPLRNGLVVTVREVRPVEVQPVGPGETAGPAVAVDLEVRNDGGQPVNLNQLSVDVTGADGVPGMPSRSELASELRGALRRGEATTGTYVFRVEGSTGDVQVDVFHGTARDVAVFGD